MFTGKARQLMVFLGEADTYQHKSLAVAIVEMLRRRGLSGATALRGIAGFGASSIVHTSAILRLSMDLPIVIIVIDRPERIDSVIEPLRQMAGHCLITVQDIEVIHYGFPFKEGLPDVTVAEVMRREVVSVRPDTPLLEVVNLLLDKDYTALPVVADGGQVVGMISDSDLLSRGGMNVTLSLKRAMDSDFVAELHRQLAASGRVVRDAMTKEVVTVGAEASLGSAARLMVARRLKRLPVVDAEHRLIGILGRLDVLNTIAAVHLPEWHPQAVAISGQAMVRDAMTTEVPAVKEDASLEEIFELLVASANKRVVVVDEARHVKGIIADSDLIMRLSRETWPGLVEMLAARVPVDRISGPARAHIAKVRARTAAELMTPDVVCVREEMPVANALALSAERRVKRLPVIDAQGTLVGIVGRTALMRALLFAQKEVSSAQP